MTKRHITIATRESPLAICQAEWVRDQLQMCHPHLSIDLLGITTTADHRLEVVLSKIGGKGLFVKELEEALLAGRADIAVHSMKDVPMRLPPGLQLPVITSREEPRDVFVSNAYSSLMQLPRGATVGTSSLRRQTQLRALRPDVEFKPLRGNINTRLKKLDSGEFTAIILAAAGLKRMDFTNRITSYLTTEQCLPAAGQGALGIECRMSDEKIMALIAPLNHPKTERCVTAERAVCRRLNGGCTIPLAAFADMHHDTLRLRALLSNSSGTRFLRASLAGDPTDADQIGTRVGEVLMQQGAANLLREFDDHSSSL